MQELKISEKATTYGVTTLSDSELVSLATGTPISVGWAVLREFGAFRAMTGADRGRWSDIVGLGTVKQAQIIAALEIGRRAMSEEREIKGPLRSPEDIAEMFMPVLRDQPLEQFKIVLLDGRNNVLRVEHIATGTPCQAVPHVRTIISAGLRFHAVGIVAIHNHPSGNTAPSRDDKMLTNALRDACGTMDIKLVDHIIIGDNSFFSFVEGGLL